LEKPEGENSWRNAIGRIRPGQLRPDLNRRRGLKSLFGGRQNDYFHGKSGGGNPPFINELNMAENCIMKQTIAILVAVLLAGSLRAQSVDLPAPQKTGGMPLMEALAKRSTARAFATNDLSPQQLSSLLWAAFGINRPDGRRTAPSARNFQETEIYVLLKSGAYVYSAASNRLDLVVAEDIRGLGGTQAFVKDAPVTLIFVADLAKIGGNNEGGKNTANIDVGYISQNVYLFCASEGLVTGARGSVDRATLGPKLKLRPDQLLVLAQSVGQPKP
jgi:nitroreductase